MRKMPKRVGSIGTLGAFSHQMGKPLAAGEGGSILTSDDEIARIGITA